MRAPRTARHWLCPCLLWLCGAVHAHEGVEAQEWVEAQECIEAQMVASAALPAPAEEVPRFEVVDAVGTAPALSPQPEAVAAEAVAPAVVAAAEFDRGVASWYGDRFHGRTTASGEPFDMNALTAAHPSLPFGTIVRVRSLVNDRVVDVRINDRGPYAGGRIIDLSRAAAAVLGLIQSGAGTKPVQLNLLESLGDKLPQRVRKYFSARRNSAPAVR